jgi:hypothetical protein
VINSAMSASEARAMTFSTRMHSTTRRCLEHLAGFLGRRLGDRRAAIGHDVDQPFQGERLQDLAYDGAADAEGLRQGILLQRSSWREAVIDDRSIEIAVDALVGLTEALLRRFRGTPAGLRLCLPGDHGIGLECRDVST